MTLMSCDFRSKQRRLQQLQQKIAELEARRSKVPEDLREDYEHEVRDLAQRLDRGRQLLRRMQRDHGQRAQEISDLDRFYMDLEAAVYKAIGRLMD